MKGREGQGRRGGVERVRKKGSEGVQKEEKEKAEKATGGERVRNKRVARRGW